MAARIPITGNGPRPPTRKDEGLASEVLDAKRHLLLSREMLHALASIALLRPSGPVYEWNPHAGLRYSLAVVDLETRTERFFTSVELDRCVTRRRPLRV